MSPDGVSASSEAFYKAYESILESIADDSGKRRKKLSSEELKQVAIVHKLVSSHGFNMPPTGEGTLSDLNDSLLYEWEESAPPSLAMQQLISLLSKSVVKSLFSAHDCVAMRRYSPQLPEVPFEVDDDDGLAVKVVRLVKGDEPLGATIKCDPQGGVYVARIIAGGVADRSACIQVRDRVLEVNGVKVTGMRPADIVKLLNSDNGVVTFHLVPADVPSIVECGEARYVRALQDYSGNADVQHPCPEAALSFRRGELLELLVTGDEHWWQARSIGFGAFASPSHTSFEDCSSAQRRVGLIPSELLHVKRRAQRESDDKFKFTQKKTLKNESAEPSMYEAVSFTCGSASWIRPVVLIGPSGVGRNELKRRLIMSNCDRYASTVPHTSRPPRAHETDGVDYNFVARDEMEQWIRLGRFLEFGEYKGNLYGTLADSVLAVIKQGRTPVLNPHPLALRLLRSATFKPFVIFVQPPDLETLKETRMPRLRSTYAVEGRRGSGAGSGVGSATGATKGFVDAELQQMITAGEQLGHHYAHCFDLVVVNDYLDVAVTQICSALARLASEPTWIPSAWCS